jgi:demethylmenaquinone methyltransferase/2-methoxy-6-polyprenyl-1,4-benzoquinol methylase
VANPFYDPGAARASKVHALFAQIARRYDVINDVQSLGLHRRWKRRLVRLAQVGPGHRALDLCCGTGDVAFALAAAGAEVVGLDFSAPMLAVARQRLTQRQRSQASVPSATPAGVQFVEGDALQLPFPEGAFDAVTIAYGLRNLADLEGGLREMLRVAKPAGRLAILDFGLPENALWRSAYFGYLRFVLPMFGWCLAGSADAYAYILESLRHYPGQRGVAQRLERLGASRVEVHPVLGGAMALVRATRAGA